jgi:hypothetical protein
MMYLSQYSHQHVLAGIPAIFTVMFLLEEYKCGGGFVHF